MSEPGITIKRRTLLQSLCAGGTLTACAMSADAFAAALDMGSKLNGSWSIRLDPDNLGEAQKWFSRVSGTAHSLPNDLTSLGLGETPSVRTKWIGEVVSRDFYTDENYARYREPGNVKVPFFLQPDTYYAGVAWYQRDIVIPKSWEGKRIELSLERAHWETRVWLEDRYIGQCESLATAHEYDLGVLKAGTYRLSVRVDNSLIHDIGMNSHAITDHTQGNWNGIVGDITLKATDATWIENLQLYPDAEKRTVLVTALIKTHTGKSGKGIVELEFGSKQQKVPVTWTAQGGKLETTVQYSEDAGLWDEFSPTLHVLTARLGGSDPLSVRFGFRKIATTRSHITINGRVTFMRGTLECAIFPETGHPPTDKAAWARIYKICRSFGLNMMRFHSYCPPKAAFDAADEAGFYLQVETCWANFSTTLGDGKPVDKWVMYETDRVLASYANHPSFVFMLYGNEPSGPKDRSPYLSKYVAHYKVQDNRMLWSGGAGWPELPENEYHVLPEPRIQRWREELKSRVNALPPETMSDYSGFMSKRSVPVMSHEIGEWCAYPDFEEVSQYTGYLKAKNFDIFKDRLSENGLGSFARDFLLASGKLQTLLYKEEIESTLRTSNMAGFQLLDLHDFPGQGTALVGVLNPFWREKGYVTASEYSRFCNVSVVLARLPKRVYSTTELLSAKAEISHFGAEGLTNVSTYWRLEVNGKALLSGQLEPVNVAIGAAQALGQMEIDLSSITEAAACKLVIGVTSASLAEPCENDWDLWVYPQAAASRQPDVVVVNGIEDAVKLTAKGKTVILSLPAKQIRNYDTEPVKFGFSTIFWNTSWSARQAPTTLGIFCDPKHPALSHFPTNAHTNWQWWYVVRQAAPLRVDLMPKGTDPIVRVIDDWFTARSLSLVSEFRCGKGKLIVCGFDLTGLDSLDQVSTQLKESLALYAVSDACQPATSIDASGLKQLVI